MKKFYMSRTIWIAIFQGLIGVLVAVPAVDPTVRLGGVILILKTVLDIFVRWNTSKEITL